MTCRCDDDGTRLMLARVPFMNKHDELALKD